MTDKQMGEKRKEFGNKLTIGRRIIEVEDVLNGIEKGLYIELNDLESDLWQWIEKLVEEVEREGYKKGLIDQSIRDVTN